MAVTPPSGPPQAGLAAGQVLNGRYRLDSALASGGMAQVWRGTDEVLRRAVAIKVLHPHLTADDTFVARFRQEAIAVAKLSHPAIVSVYDTCSDNGVEAIVMELVTGTTLRQRLDSGPMDPWTAAHIANQVAGALSVAHAAGLVHRDIKPANILLSEDGRVKVGDFGIAKAAESSTDLTQEGSFVGTAKYLAPEQVEGGPVDGRTDLYSLGVVLYEMLCARPPFESDSSSATALARLHSDPVPPRRLRADIPVDLEGIALKLLSRRPDDRYGDAHQVRAVLIDAGAEAGPHGTEAHAAIAAPAPGPGRPPVSGRRPAAQRSPGYLPPDHTQVRPTDGDEPERNWVVPTLLILLTAISLGIAGLLIGRSGSGMGDDPATPGNPGDDAPAEDLDQIPLAGFTDFDPAADGGDGAEHPGELGSINDGDPTTWWRTELYNDADIVGSSKPGVGLYVELEERAEVREVRITSPSVGWDLEIVVADEPGGDRAAWGEAHAGRDNLGYGEAVVEFDEPVEGQYVLVYFTKAGDQIVDDPTADNPASERVTNRSGQHRFMVAISDIEVRG